MKIICIGRNYVDHAKELNNSVPSEPLFFLKPDSAILPQKNPLYIPEWTSDLHYELELVVRINRLGKYIEPQFADRYYDEVGLGIDFTARDVQSICKEKGHPWEKAKAFDGSAVLSKKFVKLTDEEKDLKKQRFELLKNDQVVQRGVGEQMIFSIDQLISYVSQYMTLKIGDLIFTGTPAGVGPVLPGDTLVGKLNDDPILRVAIK